VSINGGDDDLAPFGGFRMSGNGREGGDFGLAEFLEIKALMGFSDNSERLAAR
jgi:aldehyde dehydrogenase (NAD+)